MNTKVWTLLQDEKQNSTNRNFKVLTGVSDEYSEAQRCIMF